MKGPIPQKHEVETLAFIDALRGIAIMGVIAVHTIEVMPPRTQLLLDFARTGTRGVQLFFVVSALTLFLSMASRSKRELSPNRNFFIRRFFRIAPLFSCAIILYPLIKGCGPSYFAPNGIKWWFFPLTATYLHGWLPETITSVVPGGWSIAVEMTFYLCVPLLFVLINNIWRALLFLTVSLALRVAANSLAIFWWDKCYNGSQSYIVGDFAYFWFFNQLPVFAIGILTYHIFEKIRNPSKWRGSLILFAGMIAYIAFSLTDATPYFLPAHILQSMCFAIVAIALALYPAPIIVNRFTTWIGKLSYSMYLTHFAVLGAFSRIVHLTSKRILPSDSDILFFVLFALVTLTSALVSGFTYRLIESPGILFGKKIIRQFDHRLLGQCSESSACNVGAGGGEAAAPFAK